MSGTAPGQNLGMKEHLEAAHERQLSDLAKSLIHDFNPNFKNLVIFYTISVGFRFGGNHQLVIFFGRRFPFHMLRVTDFRPPMDLIRILTYVTISLCHMFFPVRYRFTRYISSVKRIL